MDGRNAWGSHRSCRTYNYFVHSDLLDDTWRGWRGLDYYLAHGRFPLRVLMISRDNRISGICVLSWALPHIP